MVFSTLEILLLALSTQVAFASPLRRFQDTSSSAAGLKSRIPASNTQKDADSMSQTISAAKMGFSGPSASYLSSLLQFHQTATAFSSAPPPPEPTGNTQAASSRPPRTTQNSPTSSPHTTQAHLSSQDQPRFSPRPDPNNTQSPKPGGADSQPKDGVTTTTLTVTETVIPPQHVNTTVPNTGAFRHNPFRNGSTRQGGVHETGARGALNATRSTNLRTASGQPAQSEQQSAPSTTFFVLGSTTLRVTVSSGRGGIPTSQAGPSPNDKTTTTITRMRTRFSTTTVVPASSSSPAQHNSNESPSNRESGAVATRQSTTQTFPDFSFAPTSTQRPSPSRQRHRTTVLPSIVTPSMSASSSDNGASSSSAVASQSSSSASPSSSQPSTTKSGIAGITIIPVNPDATTMYITVTKTDAGVTTTVARETVTAKPCRGRGCWKGS